MSLGPLFSSKPFPAVWISLGGLGVAFFSPFNDARYFLPWRPVLASPIGISRFFSDRGLEVLQSELLWIWLPLALLAVLAWFWHRLRA